MQLKKKWGYVNKREQLTVQPYYTIAFPFVNGAAAVFDGKRWMLLTGTKEKLYEAARKSYLLDDQNNNKEAIEDQFIHTQLFALVDRSGRVRGIYDGLNKKELTKLDEDIRLVLRESYDGPRFVNGIFQNSPN